MTKNNHDLSNDAGRVAWIGEAILPRIKQEFEKALKFKGKTELMVEVESYLDGAEVGLKDSEIGKTRGFEDVDDAVVGMAILGSIVEFSETLVRNNASDDILVPMAHVIDGHNRAIVAAMPDMMDPDVRVRKFAVAQTPSILKQEKARAAAIVREAWTVEITPKEGQSADEVLANHRPPSEDDRRVSTLLIDLMTKDMTVFMTFVISEKAERQVILEPKSLIPVRWRQHSLADGMPDMWPNEGTGKFTGSAVNILREETAHS